MKSRAFGYSFTLILFHWLVALLVVLTIALGWHYQSLPTTDPKFGFYVDLHISLGLTSLILVVFLLLHRWFTRHPVFLDNYPRWLLVINNVTQVVIYLCLVLLPVTGYLQTSLYGVTVRFWGFPLPLLANQDSNWADFFKISHGYLVYVLTGFLLAHVLIALVSIGGTRRLVFRILPGNDSTSKDLVEFTENSPAEVKIANKLARNLSMVGWIEFWLQLALAFISGLLLIMATSGRTFSPSATGLGDGMLWANYAFFLVWITLILAFYYTRAAGKIALYPKLYIDPNRKLVFWFLGLGSIAGILGMMASLVGVGASISLLVAKTVSQPPGIAITDPNKIIRALDVFTLLINFSLLMAHVIGTGASIWLGIKASKAGHDYEKLTNNTSVTQNSETEAG